MWVIPMRSAIAVALGVAAVGLIATRFIGPIGMLFLAGGLIVAMVVLLAGPGDAAAVRRPDPLRFVDAPAPERPRAQPKPKATPAPSGRALWERATGRHDEVLSEYAGYELDPEMLLRFPAMWDLSSPKVIAFHDALEQAVLAEEMGFDVIWAVEHTALTNYAQMSAPETRSMKASLQSKPPCSDWKARQMSPPSVIVACFLVMVAPGV